MVGKKRLSRCLVAAVILAAVDCAGIITVEVTLTSPAQAQFRDDRFPFLSRQRPQRGGGFFGGLFGGSGGSYETPSEQPQAPVDNSRAPPPRKPDPKAEPVTPTTSVVVLGDAMADWLAYGLEDALSDSPEIAIIRKNKNHSGLLRYEAKGDLDWWHVARDTLAQEKANYVVMMLGVSDRQNIRERDLAKEADKKKGKDQADKPAAEKDAQSKNQVDEQEQGGVVAPESQPGKKANGVIEFRTDQWAEIYSKRIDETIAALKSKGVPVFWVGLPSIRGTKSTADAVYLNDLYRARAERAGVVYIDVWDGFVDEAGKYSNFGPDYEGQMRRLRSSDGVFFTKSGALKLAHYVEREIRRYMNSRATPVALPSGPLTPEVPDGKPAARPVAGPVVPLTVTPSNSEELLGGAGNSSPHGDAIATRVLVKGEPVSAPPGRADDFVLQRGGDADAPPMAAAPAEALASAPADTVRPEPATPREKKSATPKSGAAGKTTQNSAPKPKPTPKQDDVPRPPRGIFPSGGSPFGFFR
ncbi:MAG TPA: SGNH family hydrolase [Pseudolabrys sp.]